jgi:hypothetical protein
MPKITSLQLSQRIPQMSVKKSSMPMIMLVGGLVVGGGVLAYYLMKKPSAETSLVSTTSGAVTFAQTLPPCNFTDGSIVRCPTDGATYRMEGGKKRHFSPSAYLEAGSPPTTDVDCVLLAQCPSGADINSSCANATPTAFDLAEAEVPAKTFDCGGTCHPVFAGVQWGADGRMVDATGGMNAWCPTQYKDKSGCNVGQGFNNLVGDPIVGVSKRVTGSYTCVPGLY